MQGLKTHRFFQSFWYMQSEKKHTVINLDQFICRVHHVIRVLQQTPCKNDNYFQSHRRKLIMLPKRGCRKIVNKQRLACYLVSGGIWSHWGLVSFKSCDMSLKSGRKAFNVACIGLWCSAPDILWQNLYYYHGCLLHVQNTRRAEILLDAH